MPCELNCGALTIYLSPQWRGARDQVREHLEVLLSSPASFRIASQQASDREIVNALIASLFRSNERANLLIESDYLYESKPVPPESVWVESGEREDHRQCFLALIRSGVRVRTDQKTSALQHTNMILAKDKNGQGMAFLTSANLSPGSLDKHFNWGVLITENEICSDLWTAFGKAWNGNLSDVSLVSLKEYADTCVELMFGGGGQAVDLAVKTIEASRKSIKFAYFNMATDSRVCNAIMEASNRGVKVVGVVDADQATLSWDAIPLLRRSGVDVRYYPGALTGATGRMHYKMMVVDDTVLHFSTANASRAAETSLELGITLKDNASTAYSAKYVAKEIERLIINAFKPRANQ